MASPNDRLNAAASAVRKQLVTRLEQLGYSPRQLEDVQRSLRAWRWARTRAAASRQPLLAKGYGLAWGSSGAVEIVPTEVPLAGRDEVTVLVDTSAVSPGTERAQYLRLPNTGTDGPGYSCAGTVVAVGRAVNGLSSGDIVAVTGAAHASVVTVNQRSVYRVPAGVSARQAALIELGIICEQGVRTTAVSTGSPLCVLGSGLIGALTLRLVKASGSGDADVIARSSNKENTAARGGARRFLVVGRDDAAIAEGAYPFVIDSTGDPEAIFLAVRVAEPGGTVALLGSPRGTTSSLPVDEIRAKALTVVGVHVSTLNTEEGFAPGELRRRCGEQFLATLAAGTIEVDDLLGDAVDPREAVLFYRALAQDTTLVGAHFDWTTLPLKDRMRRAFVLAPPDITARGVDPARQRLSPRRGGNPSQQASSLFTLGDVFAHAEGKLRVGLLGCGEIGLANARAVANAPNAELVACFDPTPRLAAGVADTYQVKVAASAEELVSRPDVDAVFISVPHHLHAPLAELAIAAGRHVIVEKPLAHDLPAAARIVAAARSAQVAVSICFPHRYEPGALVAKRLIDAGVLGELGGSSIRLLLDKTPAYWLGGYSGRATSDWRTSRARAGGGVLIMNLTHHIDLLRHFVGVEIDDVGALLGSTDEEREVEDAVTVALRYVNGGIGSIVGGSAVRGEMSEELRVWGHDGHVVLYPRPSVFTLRAVPGLRTDRWHDFGPLPSYSARSLYVSRLATALAEGRPPEVSGEDGLAVQAVVAAAYGSMETGRSMKPNDLLREVAG